MARVNTERRVWIAVAVGSDVSTDRALVHRVGIDDSVGALRRTESHLSQFPANEVSGPEAIGVNPAVMRVDALDLQGRVACRLTRLHRYN